MAIAASISYISLEILAAVHACALVLTTVEKHQLPSALMAEWSRQCASSTLIGVRIPPEPVLYFRIRVKVSYNSNISKFLTMSETI